jgi:hypothetical protein
MLARVGDSAERDLVRGRGRASEAFRSCKHGAGKPMEPVPISAMSAVVV